MENQSCSDSNFLSPLYHFKVKNKLGVTFFSLFVLGAFLPLIDLSDFSDDTISLFTLASPTYLIILAVIGSIVNITGFSRLAARVVALIFITLIVGWLLSALFDVYQATLEWGNGRDVRLSHFIKVLTSMTGFMPNRVEDYVSLASVLLTVSFVGIAACIFSPRYKENVAFKAAVLGNSQITEESMSTSLDAEKRSDSSSRFIQKITLTLSLAIKKVTTFIQFIYLIIQPLVNSMLEKGTDIICKQNTALRREHVKMSLLAASIVVLYFIVF
jgi:hypothetical protein